MTAFTNQTEWDEFLNDPEHAPVREIASKFPPWKFFKIEETGQTVVVSAYYEDGTLKVWVHPDHNDSRDPRTGCEVFGVQPADLAPVPLDA